MIPAVTAPVRPVILSGGSGTRLWPMSRSDCPKQFLKLLPPHSLLQATARRATGERFLPPFIVANGRHSAEISAQLDQCGTPPAALILEPASRNTAPAITLAAALASETDPAAILLVMPSDHIITDVAAFHRAISQALPVAAEGWLTTFGITPTAPETGYGYIETGEEIAPGVRRARRFVEKPDRATAEDYLQSGRFSWNSGLFLFRADAFLAALGERAPAIRAAAISAITGARREGPVIRPDPIAFAASPSESIDYAVMEHWDRVAVTPVDMGWSDIGSWDALHDYAPPAESGGDIVAIDTDNCVIRSSGPLVAAVGISDLIVVATDDAVMIAPRGRSQEIRHLIADLEGRKHPSLDHSPNVATTWGSYRLLTRADKSDVYEIALHPGEILEPFVKGAASFTILTGEISLEGQAFFEGHRFEADLGNQAIANRGRKSARLLALYRHPAAAASARD